MMDIRLRDLFDEMQEGLYLTDNERRITHWNEAAERLTGYTAEQVIGSKCSDNVLMHVNEQGECLCMGECPLRDTIFDGTPREADVFMHHKNGHRVPVRVRVLPLRNSNGDIVGGAEFFSDVSSQMGVQARIKELEQLVLIDNLTMLSNRRHVEAELDRFLTEKQRYDLSFGVLFLDLDHFKNVNDTFGHNVGDLVLKTVGATLKSCARPYDTFGRWGGEEFIGLIRNIDAPNLRGLGERIRGLVAATMINTPCGKTLQVTASIGGTTARQEDDMESIIARADKNLYCSKNSGRNCLTLS
ncbi:sensor domain-containing diguanylate cyclase [Desulfatibacillum aliphaticivorans]|uniref:Diguanylate cyclase with PAS/PAC sensor n=1 Tax=Desulfatibacillum aliphaticivorans TaxID=218208 RepID=B8FLN8_DESAL|nr:sensor domain-containing diguanylate cyclase [Desulfatibacillum aliphaticivorans]ACL05392.1 diguanylate cyclase with PAS/PAC sensor [Desulfatibacillum aliphaticivorans]